MSDEREIRERIEWASQDPSRQSDEWDARDTLNRRGGAGAAGGGELLATLSLTAIVATVVGAISAGARRLR